jgi:hypothetical protein
MLLGNQPTEEAPDTTDRLPLLELDSLDERDQDVKLCNCAGCGALLLANSTVDFWRGTPIEFWPPLALKLRDRFATVEKMVAMGIIVRPFCRTCVEEKRHAIIRTAHNERFSQPRPVREMPKAVPRRARSAPRIFH